MQILHLCYSSAGDDAFFIEKMIFLLFFLWEYFATQKIIVIFAVSINNKKHLKLVATVQFSATTMKTQINNLVSGNNSTVGTSYAVREELAQTILKENGDSLNIIVRDIMLQLSISRSKSGKSWSWDTELTAEQFAILSDNLTLGVSTTHQNRYILTIYGNNLKAEISVDHSKSDKAHWKRGYTLPVAESDITIK